MTTDNSKKDFVNTKIVKGAQLAECRQSSYDADLQYVGYGKKAPHGEIDYIKPKSRSGSDDTLNPQDLQWQDISKKSEVRMKKGRHSKL